MIRAVNFTIQIEDKSIIPFEKILYEKFNVKSFKILPNTDNMFEKSSHFRKLIKLEKDARIQKEKYINEYNQSFNNGKFKNG